MTTHVIGLFDELERARQAVRELRNMGLPEADISLAAPDIEGEYGRGLDARFDDRGPDDDADDAGNGTATGAGIGAALGGLGGLLVGLGALTIPGIGPIVAAGPLATALTALLGAGAGAAAGGVTGGLLGALVDMGVSEDEAGYYSEGVRRGGVLVVARVPETMADQAANMMHLQGAVNARERAESWRERGWTGYDPDAEPYSPQQVTAERRFYAGRQDGFHDVEPSFRGHYQARYGNSGYQYEHFRPAYEYGWQLRRDDRYRGLDWTDLEPAARRGWDDRYPGSSWDDVREAVQHAWASMRDDIRDDEAGRR
jgi:hypothetical protein